MSDLVFYHKDCSDGFCAAYIHNGARSGIKEYVGYQYGDPLPDLNTFVGKDVFLLDVSFPRDYLAEAHNRAKSLIVLDHHKTAEADLVGLPFCHFDMNQSGAGMTWTYFYPDKPKSKLVAYVEDRDLWRHAIPGTGLVNNLISATEHTFTAWQQLEDTLRDEVNAEAVGLWIQRWKNIAIARAVREAVPMYLCGYNGLAVNNSTNMLFSEVAGQLAKKAEFGCCWFYDGKAYAYSLRSSESGADVSVIAKQFGGGHKHAAAFRSDSPQPLGQ